MENVALPPKTSLTERLTSLFKKAVENTVSTAEAVWHARPSFMKSAKHYIKPNHTYSAYNLTSFKKIHYGKDNPDIMQNDVLECIGLRGGGYPAFVVTSRENEKVPGGVLTTDYKSGLPLYQIGLTYKGPVGS